MWFLILEILALLFLAALLGAALAYWWVSRRYEDVTETHAQLLSGGAGASDGLTRDDLELGLSRLWQNISEQPGPDLSPVEDRLARLEARLSAPDPAAEAVQTKLSGFEAGLARMTTALQAPRGPELAQLQSDIRALAAQLQGLRPPDLRPVADKLSALTAAVSERPAADTSGLESRLDRLEAAIGSIDRLEVDLSPLDAVSAEVQALSARVDQISEMVRALDAPDVDLGPLHSGLALIEQKIGEIELPATDLAPMRGQIGAVELKLDQLGQSLSGIDSMEARLAELRHSLNGTRQSEIQSITSGLEALSSHMEPMSSRVSALSAAVSGLREPDFRPLEARLASLEHGLRTLSLPDVDLDPIYGAIGRVETRLAALETGVFSLSIPEVDLEPLKDALGRLGAELVSVKDDVRALPAAPDLSPVITSVRAMDRRLDLTALENRLTAIEYGLAAVHHMLRSRPEVEKSMRVRVEGESILGDRGAALQEREPTQRPVRTADPINPARRQNDQANLLVEPAFGDPDDLEQINGVGPMLGALLNEIGVYYFWQIAEWTPDEVAWVDGKLLHFKGRIERDDWVGQAQNLMQSRTAARRPQAFAAS